MAMSASDAAVYIPTQARWPLYFGAAAAAASGPNDPIRPEQLFPLDQWHYHGIDAVRSASDELGLRPGSRVLAVGSGIGGPARFLAHIVGCHDTALELQPKLHAIASNLTLRCGLGEHVTHLCGDALDYPLPEATFDAVVSWLVMHHVSDRSRLCTRLVRALRPGGGCYIEDLYMRAPFSPEGLRDVLLRASACTAEKAHGPKGDAAPHWLFLYGGAKFDWRWHDTANGNKMLPGARHRPRSHSGGMKVAEIIQNQISP
jgi:SAM-dependent methyltransferase